MTVRAAWTVCLALLVPAVARAQEPAAPDKDGTGVHIRMHKKTAPKVVFVKGGSQMGSGVVLQADGVILTSPTACGKDTENATVILPGFKEMKAKVIGRANHLELVLLKIEAKGLPAMEFADSAKARIGQVAYAFGDVFGSIQIDDQVAMSQGVVSAIYDIQETHARAIYTGSVIETSAAVNPNLDGGPLVDAQGRMLGLITLNYHTAKFTGLAIPAHVLKPEIDRLIKEFREGIVRVPIGIEVEESKDLKTGVRITAVREGSPGEKSGLMAGDVILGVDSEKVTSLKRFEELLRGVAPGAKARFRIERDGAERDLTVTTGKKTVETPVY
jgi:serine protease Do